MPDNAILADFVAECRGLVAGEVRDDLYSRVLYSTDASLYQLMPLAVVVPRTTEDVMTAVSLAAARELPLLPRGAGTSLAGQAVNEAVVLDFTRYMDAILEVNTAERWARVQPGVVLDDLNAALRPHGLQFGPDPASGNRSTIGGAVANNATGSHSLLYGMTADHVLAMEVVTIDGLRVTLDGRVGDLDRGDIRVAKYMAQLIGSEENQRIIREGTPRYWRRCGGYNLDRLLPGGKGGLAHLICGSEGTLAVMTEITVNLVSRPSNTALVLLQFDDLHTALEAVPFILESDPAAVELLDNLSLTLCREVPAYARLLASVIDGRPHSLLIVEFEGESDAQVRGRVDDLARRVNREGLGVTGITRAMSAESQAAIWGVRKVGLGLLMAQKGDMKPVPFIEDAAVPVADLPEYVRRIEGYCAGLDTPITYYAHAGAGCLHIRPLINRRSAEQVARMPDIARFSASLVKGFGGALSSEHGDGRTRSWLNEEFFGPELYSLYRQVKRIFDPRNLLNPGVIVDAAPMTEAMRVLPQPAGHRSHIDFGDHVAEGGNEFRIASIENNNTGNDDGFVRALELCNGAGVCRRRDRGTMCPSFMVTRDEEHSTRGRANALMAAMSGVLPPGELTSPRMYAVMSLCVSCKACKAECPSAVDMARIKTEFLARYHEAHGVPLRDRFFGHAALLNRLGSGFRAPLANAVLGSAPGRVALSRMVGLARERPLPRLARETFMTWWDRREPMDSPARPRGDAVLVIDPFTNANHPEVGRAAVAVLERVGVRINAALLIDDGRAFISRGLVGEARRAAERAVTALSPWTGRGLPIVGLEPSSLLTLRDEYHYLLPGDNRVAEIAMAALTFEEYIDNLSGSAGDSGEGLRACFTEESRQVLLHGHCHQKALIGTGPARRALSLPPGYVVTEVDSGCCGMAGSFGYEAEHYALSMQMAERRLLPAIRAAAPETIIAAAGVSCREQIAHGSGRVALHPAQVLFAALKSN